MSRKKKFLNKNNKYDNEINENEGKYVQKKNDIRTYVLTYIHT